MIVSQPSKIIKAIYLKQNPHKSGVEENQDPNEPPNIIHRFPSCEGIEDGTAAFLQWMGSSDK